jgi:putative proteasome-type protease
MTYCVGIRVNDGLVFASDTRTSAGVDDVRTYNKIHRGRSKRHDDEDRA